MIRSLVLLLISAATAVGQEAPGEPAGASLAGGVIGPDVWMSPRHGETFLQHESVASAVRQWLATPDGKLVVRYPQGEDGELWGLELKAWLVALGIASDVIELVDDHALPNAIQLVYAPAREAVTTPRTADETISTEPGITTQESP